MIYCFLCYIVNKFCFPLFFIIYTDPICLHIPLYSFLDKLLVLNNSSNIILVNVLSLSDLTNSSRISPNFSPRSLVSTSIKCLLEISCLYELSCSIDITCLFAICYLLDLSCLFELTCLLNISCSIELTRLVELSCLFEKSA